MKLGLPYSTYIFTYEISILSAVLAMQCARRLDNSLEARAAHSMSPLNAMWQALYLAGVVAWLPLLVLPFLQFRLFTASAYVFGGALASAILVGIYFGLRRSVDELIVVHRIAAAMAFGAAVLLWTQAIL